MHSLTRLALLLFVASVAPAVADSLPVKVHVPAGLRAGDISTSDSSKPGFKYVTLDSIDLVNPSRHIAQGYEPANFHLLVGEKSFTPSVRPGLAAIDVHQGSVLAPGGSERVTVSFLVPDGTAEAKFEFTPHWQDDDGATVDWCCFYL